MKEVPLEYRCGYCGGRKDAPAWKYCDQPRCIRMRKNEAWKKKKKKEGKNLLIC